MPLGELVAALVEKDLVEARFADEPGAFVDALAEDNKKREDAGRQPQFQVSEVEGGSKLIGLTVYPEFPPAPREPRDRDRDGDRGRGAERERPAEPRPLDAAAPASAQPHGRPVMPEPRRNALRELRRRLVEADLAVLERLTQTLLEKQGFRDVRVAKRSKEGPLFTARRRLGIVDIRFAIRLLKGGRDVTRQDLQEVRKDLSHYSAQLGAILSPADVHRDARGDASAAGQATVFVYAGEAFAEELANAGVGIVPTFVVDDAMFAAPLGEREIRGSGRPIHPPAESAAPADKPAEASPAQTAASTASEPAAAAVAGPGAAGSSAPELPASDAGEKPADGDASPEPATQGSWLGRVFKGLTK